MTRAWLDDCAAHRSKGVIELLLDWPTFALDNIVKRILVRHLTLSQSENQLFMVTRQNKIFEGAIIPTDLPNGADAESHCQVP